MNEDTHFNYTYDLFLQNDYLIDRFVYSLRNQVLLHKKMLARIHKLVFKCMDSLLGSAALWHAGCQYFMVYMDSAAADTPCGCVFHYEHDIFPIFAWTCNPGNRS